MFSITVYDLVDGFRVEVYAQGSPIVVLPWQGGDFTYIGQQYEVRGPYHGLQDYKVYRMVDRLTPVVRVRV